MIRGLLGIFPYKLRHCSRALADDSSGTVLTITALAMPVLIGFAGLAIDAASWFVQKRILQASADAAAVAAAIESHRGAPAALANLAAATDAARNGYDAASDALQVNLPPASGRFAGKAGAAEVLISREAPSFFTRALIATPPTISARAVAIADSEAAKNCVWALDGSEKAALKVSGNAEIALDCGVVVNSSAGDALKQVGSSCLAASRISIAGGYSGSCVSPTPRTGLPPVADPLATLPPPTFGGCDVRSKTKVNSGERLTLSPGVYCGSIEVSARGELELLPGLYVLDGAGLKISGQARLSGSGVTIYLTRNSGPSNGVSFSGGAEVTLSAPTSGTYAGILFYSDRAAPANVSHSFTGGSMMRLDGVLYFPNQDVKFSGGSSLAQTSSVLVARTIDFTGNADVDIAGAAAVRATRLMIRARVVD